MQISDEQIKQAAEEIADYEERSFGKISPGYAGPSKPAEIRAISEILRKHLAPATEPGLPPPASVTVIRDKLSEAAANIDAKIERLERGERVSQETMQMEFRSPASQPPASRQQPDVAGKEVPDRLGCYWLLWFDDAERDSEVFTDEAAARRRFQECSLSWHCKLFVQAPATPPIAADDRAELERLRVQLAEMTRTYKSLGFAAHDHTPAEMLNTIAEFWADDQEKLTALRQQLATAEQRIAALEAENGRLRAANAAAIAHCRQHEHPGVSPGYQQACSEIRKLLEGESK